MNKKLWLAASLFVVIGLFNCGDDGGSSSNDVDLASSFSSNMSSSLKNAGLTDEQADTITDSGTSNTSGTLDVKSGIGRDGGSELDNFAPLFAEGAISALDEAGVSDTIIYRIVEVITTVIIETLGEFQDDFTIDEEIVGNITQLAISALDEAGFDADEIAAAAAKISAGATGALDEGGFPFGNMELLLETLNQGAIAGLQNIDINGFNDQMLIASVGQISAGSVGALDGLDGFSQLDNDFIGDFAGFITSGCTAGLDDAGFNAGDDNFQMALMELNTQAVGALDLAGLEGDFLTQAVGDIAAGSIAALGGFGGFSDADIASNMQYITTGATQGIESAWFDSSVGMDDFMLGLGEAAVGAFGAAGLPSDFFKVASQTIGAAMYNALDTHPDFDPTDYQSAIENGMNAGFNDFQDPLGFDPNDAFDTMWMNPGGFADFDPAADCAAFGGTWVDEYMYCDWGAATGPAGGSACYSFDGNPDGCDAAGCLFNDDNGFCDPELAGGAGAECFAIDPATCDSNPECKLDGEGFCVPNDFNEVIAEDCLVHPDPFNCDNAAGCFWDGQFCAPLNTGTAVDCSTITNDSVCVADPFCEWNGDACQDSPEGACAGYPDEGSCVADSNCGWDPGPNFCFYDFGSACAGFVTAPTCDGEPDCEWNGDACLPLPPPSNCSFPDQTSCDGDPLCVWVVDHCETDCAPMDEPTCNIEPTCNWTGSVCEPGGAPCGFGDQPTCDGDNLCFWYGEINICAPTNPICDIEITAPNCNTLAPNCAWDPNSNKCITDPCSAYIDEIPCNGNNQCAWLSGPDVCENQVAPLCYQWQNQAACDGNAPCAWDIPTAECKGPPP